jgi:hypothetical protein
VAPAAGLLDIKINSRWNLPYDVFFDSQKGFVGFLDHVPSYGAAITNFMHSKPVSTFITTIIYGVQGETDKRCRITDNMASQLNHALCRAKANDLHIIDTGMMTFWHLSQIRAISRYGTMLHASL